MSTQALDKRFTPAAEAFLSALLATALRQHAASADAVASVLTHFNGVYLIDGTQLDVDTKLLTRLNLSDGQMTFELAASRRHDNRIALAHAALPVGALRLTDLGFFDLNAFARTADDGSFWLTRYKARTALFCPQTGRKLDLLARLRQHDQLDCPVLVGTRQRLPARLIARRVSPEQAAQRRQRRSYRAQRKQQPVSAVTFGLADWEIYLTNIPDLPLAAICALAHARWQIEIVFKVWKSFWGLVLPPRTTNPVRYRCLVLAKLLALWVAHQLLRLDPHPNRSWWQAAQTLRDQAVSALAALASTSRWHRFLHRLQALFPQTARLSRRKSRPRTFQLLTDFP